MKRVLRSGHVGGATDVTIEIKKAGNGVDGVKLSLKRYVIGSCSWLGGVDKTLPENEEGVRGVAREEEGTEVRRRVLCVGEEGFIRHAEREEQL